MKPYKGLYIKTNTSTPAITTELVEVPLDWQVLHAGDQQDFRCDHLNEPWFFGTVEAASPVIDGIQTIMVRFLAKNSQVALSTNYYFDSHYLCVEWDCENYVVMPHADRCENYTQAVDCYKSKVTAARESYQITETQRLLASPGIRYPECEHDPECICVDCTGCQW